MNQKRYSRKQKIELKAKYIAALRKSLGVQGPALAAVGIQSRQTILNWRKADPVFDEMCKEATELALDMGETALFKNVKRGDTQAIKFLLGCKGKDRGYAERQQVDVNATATIIRPRIVYEDEVAPVEGAAPQYNPEIDD